MNRQRRFYPDMIESIAIGLVLFPLAGGFLASLATKAVNMIWPGTPDTLRETEMLISYLASFIPVAAYISAREFGQSSDVKRSDGPYFSLPHADRNMKQKTAISAACILAGISLSFILSFISAPLPENGQVERMLGMVREGGIIMFVATTVLPATLEELLCRGIILKSLLGYGKQAAAVLLSALIFAAMHMNPTQGIPAFLAGCVIGWIYIRTGSVRSAILVHFMNNAASFAMTRSEIFQYMSDKSGIYCTDSILLTIFMAFALAASCVAVHINTKITRKRK